MCAELKGVRVFRTTWSLGCEMLYQKLVQQLQFKGTCERALSIFNVLHKRES